MEIGEPRNTTAEEMLAGANYALARNSNAEFFEGLCPEHGWQIFNTKSRKCPACRKKPGRKYDNSPRACARRAEQTVYYDSCAIHGPAPFDVAHGKCQRCFTAMGRPRRQLEPTARTIARREHRKTFVGECEKHGTAWHSVAHGRCLACYTTAGAVRAPARSFVIE